MSIDMTVCMKYFKNGQNRLHKRMNNKPDSRVFHVSGLKRLQALGKNVSVQVLLLATLKMIFNNLMKNTCLYNNFLRKKGNIDASH